MGTKIVTARAKGDGAAAGKALAETLHGSLEGRAPDLVVAFASTAQELGDVAGALCDRFGDAVVLTASTAGEFDQSGDCKGEAVAWAVSSESLTVAAGIGKDLSADADAAVSAAIPALEVGDDQPHRTAIVLLDPLAGNGEEAALLASALLGPTTRLAGGAAGDDLKFECTKVGVGREVHDNAVVIAVIASAAPLGIGVSHGHTPISPPIIVSKAEGATVFELNDRPALEVWKDAVRAEVAKNGGDIDAIADADLGGKLLEYEAGLIVGANEYKIRAPLSVGEGGSLNFACGLPEGSVVRIMKGEAEAQVASAREAASRARAALGESPVAGALIFDCICRNLVLGEQFQTAVAQMHEVLGGAPLAGFETYGEIAMELGQSSGFHNTTTVVLAFPE